MMKKGEKTINNYEKDKKTMKNDEKQRNNNEP